MIGWGSVDGVLQSLLPVSLFECLSMNHSENHRHERRRQQQAQCVSEKSARVVSSSAVRAPRYASLPKEECHLFWTRARRVSVSDRNSLLETQPIAQDTLTWRPFSAAILYSGNHASLHVQLRSTEHCGASPGACILPPFLHRHSTRPMLNPLRCVL